MKFQDFKKEIEGTSYINHPNKFGEDGVDHININMVSNTKLGKVLDPAYMKVIVYPDIGKFRSVYNLWYWLRDPDHSDALRRIKLKSLKNYAIGKKSFNNFIPNFKAIIGYATWLKISAYPEVIEELKGLDDDVVFLSYYVVESSKLRVSTNYSKLMVDIANIIRQAVRENEEPDFSALAYNSESKEKYYLDQLDILS
jgi:hypothetical protein